ncbi:DNA adenine methylase [Methanobacterium petrolearium]|uniref:DNA adenine methylase n=1 Tax=Methanobacterium petrolearium TaxID=710190 RepID=UPI001AE9D8D4|nr:DNA adenine methylase [Methanobacterium petrolearium]MBP1945626.1 DNA adenine methylase [Methanobacterium petrolearium]
MVKISSKNFKVPRPFLKWAGGKTQLLLELEKRLPQSILNSGIIEKYVEPFVGGGAMFFFLKRNYQVKHSILIDINPELILTYRVLQDDHLKLIDKLNDMEDEHLRKSEESRKENYYHIRSLYNRQMDVIDYDKYVPEWIHRAAYLIFLNKTCFNGLFRSNSNGEFNVPFGRYKNPTICDEVNLQYVHQALKKTELLCADFTRAEEFIEKDTLVYLDPPYRPLNSTSHFTRYSSEGFDDEDQMKLAKFYKKMDQNGSNLILSNSDPKNHDINDNFFDELYNGYNIQRVLAKRNINSKTSRRGEIKELIIRNY